MSSLVLVRHGQASFFADDYDQLSPLGEEQSRHLARYWIERGVTFDEVFTGPRARQRRTEELVAETFREAGNSWPLAETAAEFDEYDLGGITTRLLPACIESDERLAALARQHSASTEPREKLRNFQAMFEVLMTAWIGLSDTIEGVESWEAFQQRVARGLDRLTRREGRSRRIVVFTSGGFIGAAVQSVLAAPNGAALELNWRVRNTAVSEILFTESRRSLDSFNSVAHLPKTELVSYR